MVAANCCSMYHLDSEVLDKEDKEDKEAMFIVTDNGNPANENGFPRLKGHGWTQGTFTTWEAAVKYARNWLGEYDVLPALLEEQKPDDEQFSVDYSGCGDVIEIKPHDLQKSSD